MTGTWLKRAAVLLLCAGFSCFWAFAMRRATAGPIKDLDFDAIYYGARCGTQGIDPYTRLPECEVVDGRVPATVKSAETRPEELYLPTALWLAVPFALLPLPIAESVWIYVTACSLALAALLMWDLAGDAPVLCGCLAGFVLLNCAVLLEVGNLAGICSAFCVIAAWCFVRGRYAAAGAVLLAAGAVLLAAGCFYLWVYWRYEPAEAGVRVQEEAVAKA